MTSAPHSMSPARRWLYAAKPASWAKLLSPFLLGQAIGLAGGGPPSALAFVLGLAFTLLDLLFIVFLNDWGDREVDAIKRRMFPRGCSPKTIPDGILPARHLLLAGALSGAAALGAGLTAEIALGRPGLGVLAFFALAIFVAYTLPPLKLNYRGGGEVLEMLGVGVVLPWMQAYLQGGELLTPGLWLLPGFALLSLASAIASGLADERSDRRGGKHTFVTRAGNPRARRTIEALTFAGAAAWAIAPALSDALPWWIGALPAGVAFGYGLSVVAASGAARTDAFAAQKRYKQRLHHAIWRGALVAAMLLAWWRIGLTAR